MRFLQVSTFLPVYVPFFPILIPMRGRPLRKLSVVSYLIYITVIGSLAKYIFAFI
jgi:hypothetical protein